MSGPLHGVKVLELGGIGPAPFAGMMLADHGAEVTHVTRPLVKSHRGDLTTRGKRSMAIDLKNPEGAAAVLDLIEGYDIVIEGFRPLVAERLGLGPEACFARNKALVFGRMTGWGQDGPLSQVAGHDINYISLSGALDAIGLPGERPVPPLNLVGDFGGGAMFLAFGVLSALLSARSTGQGQVVDAAMLDGASVLMMPFYDMASRGQFGARGTNFLDGGAHFYGTYETLDGTYVSVGPLEPQFYGELLERIGLNAAELPGQMSSKDWPALRDRLAEEFLQRTRDEWVEVFDGSDACFAPVLNVSEAPSHPHNVARQTFTEVDGKVQPIAAPRFAGTPNAMPKVPPMLGEHTREILNEAGFDSGRIASLQSAGAIL